MPDFPSLADILLQNQGPSMATGYMPGMGDSMGNSGMAGDMPRGPAPIGADPGIHTINWSNSIIGAKKTNVGVPVPSVITEHDFFYSIDGPCWVFGIIYAPETVSYVDTFLYDATPQATFNEDFVSNVFQGVHDKMPSAMIPIGFCTDGVTVEAYGMYDVVPVAGGRLGMDTPAYGAILGRGGRLAVHAHFNVVCKRAAEFVKVAYSASVSSGILNTIGHQAIGVPEQDGPDIDGSPVGAIVATGGQSMYLTHNMVASPDAMVLTGLAVFQVMTKRADAINDTTALSERLQLSPLKADLLLVNVFLTDPYIAFMGQQPSFIEAKFVCFGLSAEPTPVAIKSEQGSDFRGVPRDLPGIAGTNTVVAVSSNGGSVIVKGHIGNYPSAVEVSPWNAYHLFGWSAKRLGSMI